MDDLIKAPEDFTQEEVWQWLSAFDLKDHIPVFQDNAIDGSMLVTLSKEDLTEELGLSVGEADKVHRMLDFSEEIASGATSNGLSTDPRVQSLESENEALRLHIANMENDIRDEGRDDLLTSHNMYPPVPSNTSLVPSVPCSTAMPADIGPSYVLQGQTSAPSYTSAPAQNPLPSVPRDTQQAASPPLNAYVSQQTTSAPSYVQTTPLAKPTSGSTGHTAPTPYIPVQTTKAAPYVQSNPQPRTPAKNASTVYIPPQSTGVAPYVAAPPSYVQQRTPRTVYVPMTMTSATPYVPTTTAYTTTRPTSSYRSQPKVYVPYQPASNNLEGQMARYI